MKRIPQKWQTLGNRLVEIDNDQSLPWYHPKISLYKINLAFDACEQIIGTRKVSELRQMLSDMGFNSQAALSEFREYWKTQIKEA